MFNDPLKTAEFVDLDRYLGRWFEIARLPNSRQSDECSDVRIDYAFDDQGTLRLSRRCVEPDGSSRTDEGRVAADELRRARLRVSWMPDGLRWLPFTRRDHWILRIDDDYTMALIGARNRHRLWLLSRTRLPDPGLRDDFLAFAERQRYDLTALLYTPQEHVQAPRERPLPRQADDASPARRGQALQVQAVRSERGGRSPPPRH